MGKPPEHAIAAAVGPPARGNPPSPPRRRRKRRRVILFVLLTGYLTVAGLGGCADFFLLHPSHDPIAAPGATRLEVSGPAPTGLPIEVYTLRPNDPKADPAASAAQATPTRAAAAAAEPSAFLLVFDGTNCRAERSVFWGADLVGPRAVEVWAVNYPGFGGSPGKPALATIGPAALAAYDALKQRAAGRPVVVWGASLGTTAALHVAARRPVAGLVLTNPPPLRPLILGRYGWWNLWLLAGPVSAGIPDDLDSLANAARATGPALVASADDDATVPPAYQQQVIDAYAGPKRVVRLPGAGHDTPAAKAAPGPWRQGLDWLWQQVGR